MQTILVIITFTLALGFLLKKFVWDAIIESKQNTSVTLGGKKINSDSGKGRCAKNNCGCH